MRINGLANQWKTRDCLFYEFAEIPSEEQQAVTSRLCSKIRELLFALERLDGPDLYIGTSHKSMNFSNRDVRQGEDRTWPFAFVHIAGKSESNLYFRTESRRIYDNRPTTEWIIQDFMDAEQAAKHILDSLLYADIPSRQIENNNCR